jgi:ribosomal protein L11 methyltransferase
MHNPFAQVSQYFQVSFILPFASAEHVQDSFDGIALSASAFEVDELLDQWRCDVLFAQPPDMAEVTRRAALLAMLAGKPTPQITTSTIAQQDWLSLVARNFPPLVIERFYVHGSHVTDAPPIASIPIQVEAGAAFGSGEHGTTRCCLQALAWIAKRRAIYRILDMGTGSGILAIAAAKLWNTKILAVDIDPIAVEVTADNVRINQTQNAIRCAVSDGYKSKVVQKFGTCDLVIANILARPLVSFAPRLARTLSEDGYCVLSGLLVDQEKMVFSAHRMQGLKLVKRFTHEGWCTLVLQK